MVGHLWDRPGFCEMVRTAIDLTLDAATLPDATILLPTFAGEAQAQIAARDPLLASRPEDELDTLTTAAALLTAAALVPRLPAMVRERFGGTRGYDYERTPLDTATHVARLAGEADTIIRRLIAPGDPQQDRPIFFGASTAPRPWLVPPPWRP